MQENRREKSQIKERILQYLDLKGITKYAFYKATGISRGILDQETGISEDNLSRFLSYAQDVSPVWLLTGAGNIFNDMGAGEFNPGKSVAGNVQNISKNLSEQERQLYEFSRTADIASDSGAKNNYKAKTQSYMPNAHTYKQNGLQQVPLYDLDATSGLAELFRNPRSQTPASFISLPDLPPCDGAVYVKGDSMYPLLKSGDIVLYKQVGNAANVIWGEMYLISFSLNGDEYTAVKYIKKHESDQDKVVLASYNPHHAPMEIPVRYIRALGIVKASVCFNTMG